jgi:hypothetical protein
MQSSYDHLFGSPQRQAAVVVFLRRVARPGKPACGEVPFTTQIPYSAPLEYLHSTQRSRRDAVVIRSRTAVPREADDVRLPRGEP